MDRAGEANAAWQKPWTRKELKEAVGNWSLGADVGLLLHLKDFSARLVARTNEVEEEIDGLVTEAKLTESRAHNAFNSFLMLANTQFIENRVYEDLPQLPVQEVPSEPEKSREQREAEMVSKFGSAVQSGLAVIDQSMDIHTPTVDLDHFPPGHVPSSVLVSKRRYQDRPLPCVIGSSRYMTSTGRNLYEGRPMGHDLGSSSGLRPTQRPSKSATPSSRRESSNQQVTPTPQTPPQDRPTPISTISEQNDGFGGSQQPQPHPAARPRPGGSEAENTEFGSGGNISVQGERPAVGRDLFGDDSEDKRDISSMVAARIMQQAQERVSAEEEAPPDDDPFGDGRLFSSVGRRPDLFDDVTTELPPPVPHTKDVEPAPSKPSFGLLLGNENQPSPTPTAPSRPAPNAPAKALPTSLFGSGGLFDEEPPEVKKPAGAVGPIIKFNTSLFDDDDDFATPPPPTASQSKPGPPVVTQRPSPSEIPRSASQTPKPASKSTSLFGGSDDDVFAVPKIESQPQKPTIQPPKSSSLFGDSDEEAGQRPLANINAKPTPSMPAPAPTTKPTKAAASLFDTDSEDEGIFGSKPPSSTPKTATGSGKAPTSAKLGETGSVGVPGKTEGGTEKPAEMRKPKSKLPDISVQKSIVSLLQQNLVQPTQEPNGETRKTDSAKLSSMAAASGPLEPPQKVDNPLPQSVIPTSKAPVESGKTKKGGLFNDPEDEGGSISRGTDAKRVSVGSKKSSVFGGETDSPQFAKSSTPSTLSFTQDFDSSHPATSGGISATSSFSNQSVTSGATKSKGGVKASLFDSDDDGMFAAAPPKRPQKKTGAASTKSPTSLFGESDDDIDTIFGSKPSSRPPSQTSKPGGGAQRSSIFGDEEEDVLATVLSSKPTQPPSQPKPTQPETTPKRQSLFADDDGPLFGTKEAQKDKVTVEEKSPVDLPGSNRKLVEDEPQHTSPVSESLVAELPHKGEKLSSKKVGGGRVGALASSLHNTAMLSGQQTHKPRRPVETIPDAAPSPQQPESKTDNQHTGDGLDGTAATRDMAKLRPKGPQRRPPTRHTPHSSEPDTATPPTIDPPTTSTPSPPATTTPSKNLLPAETGSLSPKFLHKDPPAPVKTESRPTSISATASARGKASLFGDSDSESEILPTGASNPPLKDPPVTEKSVSPKVSGGEKVSLFGDSDSEPEILPSVFTEKPPPVSVPELKEPPTPAKTASRPTSTSSNTPNREKTSLFGDSDSEPELLANATPENLAEKPSSRPTSTSKTPGKVSLFGESDDDLDGQPPATPKSSTSRPSSLSARTPEIGSGIPSKAGAKVSLFGDSEDDLLDSPFPVTSVSTPKPATPPPPKTVDSAAKSGQKSSLFGDSDDELDIFSGGNKPPSASGVTKPADAWHVSQRLPDPQWEISATGETRSEITDIPTAKATPAPPEISPMNETPSPTALGLSSSPSAVPAPTPPGGSIAKFREQDVDLSIGEPPPVLNNKPNQSKYRDGVDSQSSGAVQPITSPLFGVTGEILNEKMATPDLPPLMAAVLGETRKTEPAETRAETSIFGEDSDIESQQPQPLEPNVVTPKETELNHLETSTPLPNLAIGSDLQASSPVKFPPHEGDHAATALPENREIDSISGEKSGMESLPPEHPPTVPRPLEGAQTGKRENSSIFGEDSDTESPPPQPTAVVPMQPEPPMPDLAIRSESPLSSPILSPKMESDHSAANQASQLSPNLADEDDVPPTPPPVPAATVSPPSTIHTPTSNFGEDSNDETPIPPPTLHPNPPIPTTVATTTTSLFGEGSDDETPIPPPSVTLQPQIRQPDSVATAPPALPTPHNTTSIFGDDSDDEPPIIPPVQLPATASAPTPPRAESSPLATQNTASIFGSDSDDEPPIPPPVPPSESTAPPPAAQAPSAFGNISDDEAPIPPPLSQATQPRPLSPPALVKSETPTPAVASRPIPTRVSPALFGSDSDDDEREAPPPLPASVSPPQKLSVRIPPPPVPTQPAVTTKPPAKTSASLFVDSSDDDIFGREPPPPLPKQGSPATGRVEPVALASDRPENYVSPSRPTSLIGLRVSETVREFAQIKGGGIFGEDSDDDFEPNRSTRKEQPRPDSTLEAGALNGVSIFGEDSDGGESPSPPPPPPPPTKPASPNPVKTPTTTTTIFSNDSAKPVQSTHVSVEEQPITKPDSAPKLETGSASLKSVSLSPPLQTEIQPQPIKSESPPSEKGNSTGQASGPSSSSPGPILGVSFETKTPSLTQNTWTPSPTMQKKSFVGGGGTLVAGPSLFGSPSAKLGSSTKDPPTSKLSQPSLFGDSSDDDMFADAPAAKPSGSMFDSPPRKTTGKDPQKSKSIFDDISSDDDVLESMSAKKQQKKTPSPRPQSAGKKTSLFGSDEE